MLNDTIKAWVGERHSVEPCNGHIQDIIGRRSVLSPVIPLLDYCWWFWGVLFYSPQFLQCHNQLHLPPSHLHHTATERPSKCQNFRKTRILMFLVMWNLFCNDRDKSHDCLLWTGYPAFSEPDYLLISPFWFVCWPACLPVWLNDYPSLYWSLSPLHPFVYQSFCLSVSWSVSQSVCQLVCCSVCQSFSQLVSLTVSLSVSPSVIQSVTDFTPV